MIEEDISNRVFHATKWSIITEVAAKLVSPIINMILARIISPEAFGVVATVTMIVSFADMFTDAGFQKYIIQHQFTDEEDKYRSSNVAFWTNFTISVFLFLLIVLFRNSIAVAVGNPGLGNVIAIACVQLLLTSFSSIQMGLLRRDFKFKSLFYVRMIAICIPFVVTIPLACFGLSYWAIIIGSIFIQLSNAIVLTVKSRWKPALFFNIKILRKMLSFSIWSLIEAISIWFTTWVDVFIVGSSLSQYYLGIYKTSTAMVNTLIALVTSATTPILFSALSRQQENKSRFNHMFFKAQRLVSIIIFPIGVGTFLFSDLTTQILLGSQWKDASKVIGIWSLTSSIVVVFGFYCSDVYRAKGRPKLSFMAQILHLIVLVPTCLISAKYGFLPLVYARSLVRMQLVLVHLLIMNYIIGISIKKIFQNVYSTLLSVVSMGIFAFYLRKLNESLVWSIASVIICSIFYFGILSLFPDMRKEMINTIKRLTHQKKKEVYLDV